MPSGRAGFFRRRDHPVRYRNRFATPPLLPYTPRFAAGDIETQLATEALSLPSLWIVDQIPLRVTVADMVQTAASQSGAMMPDKCIRPVVVVSQCLGFAAVRYNGQILHDDFVQALGEHVDFVQTCPEVGIGLGVPRDPIRIVETHGKRRLLQPASQKDVTDAMNRFSSSFLDHLSCVDGFILKSRSPSCGIKDVKLFGRMDGETAIGKTRGIFAEAVINQFPNAAIEEEGCLTNAPLRHHFLVKLFANAWLRRVKEANELPSLIEFHSRYKFQLMTYSQAGLHRLGRIVANRSSEPSATVVDRYEKELGRVLSQPPKPSNTKNALLHAFGYVSEQLEMEEKEHFLLLLEEYGDGQTPLNVLLSWLRSWAVRFDHPSLKNQRLFEPYPRALLQLTDSAVKAG